MVISYFMWRSIFGNHSIFQYYKLQSELSVYENKLNELRLLKAKLQYRSNILNPKKVDPDLLDEIARKSLDVLKKSESIIINH